MAFSFICFIIASFLAAIAVILVFASPHELASYGPIDWFLFAFLFHGIGHWIPGATR